MGVDQLKAAVLVKRSQSTAVKGGTVVAGKGIEGSSKLFLGLIVPYLEDGGKVKRLADEV